MLYLIGLGLNSRGISVEGREIVSSCNKVYLEGYTVDFPYSVEELKKSLEVDEIEVLDRSKVEDLKLINESKDEDVALLISGAPLFATTHMTLIKDCREANVDFKVIYAASIFDAIARTGLELYKFGKISSMPKWQKSFEPTSFLDYVKENNSINAHSIILIDIGLEIKDALDQLSGASSVEGVEVKELVVCSEMGTENEKIFYGSVEELREKISDIKLPYCFVIPSEMHFMEKDALEEFRI